MVSSSCRDRTLVFLVTTCLLDSVVFSLIMSQPSSPFTTGTQMQHDDGRGRNSTIESPTPMACAECRRFQNSFNANEWKALSLRDRLSARNTVFRLCLQSLPDIDENQRRLCHAVTEQFLALKRKYPRDALHLCDMMGICSSMSSSTGTDGMVTLDGNSSSNIPAVANATNLNSAGIITFVQVSDIHIDDLYERGSSVRCVAKICCRKSVLGMGSAGRYGEYRCDAVTETVEEIMRNVAQISPPPAFIVYAGDNAPHNTGFEKIETRLKDNKHVNDLLRDTFRSIAPIYPTIGNHDVFPENVYLSRGKNTKIILNKMAEQWSELFDVSDEQRNNIQTNGFYTTLVQPGLRILSVNSLTGYTLNPVSFLSAFDGTRKKQEEFMFKTLSDAKANSEKVILLSHLKPNHLNAHRFYTKSMESMVADFKDTIILMLFGHEHVDTFTLSTDPSDRSRVTGAFLAAPSVTPYVFLNMGTNPSYRVFKLDASTFKPLDYDQLYVDLKAANDEGSVTVKKHYSFTEEYNAADLSPESFQGLTKRIVKDWTVFQKFERNRDVLAALRKKCKETNLFCRRSLTCETVAPTLYRYAKCLLGLKM